MWYDNPIKKSNVATTFVVGKIDSDEQPDLTSQFGVMSISTFVLKENRKMINTSVAVKPKKN